jgi:hypothetical protein
MIIPFTRASNITIRGVYTSRIFFSKAKTSEDTPAILIAAPVRIIAGVSLDTPAIYIAAPAIWFAGVCLPDTPAIWIAAPVRIIAAPATDIAGEFTGRQK